MTDEEMAYEYAKYDDNGRVSVNDDKFKAFLVGLKAGRTKWHKVADGDLPEKEQLGKSFTVAFAFNEMTHEYYSFDCAEYIDKGKFCTHTNNDDKVIAWCEIPQYTEE